MVHQLVFSDEELDQLECMLRHELETSHHELRRTRNPDFRAQILRRIGLAECMLSSCRHAQAKPVG